MPISLSSLLKNAAPSPRVVLLPDALFFVRTIPVAPEATTVELVSQVELALEAIAPFPLSQLYYGFYRPADAAIALVYSAYRKRFTTEQTAAWAGADLVIPSFVALLGGEAKPGTTLVSALSDGGVTVVHWRNGLVPDKIANHVFAPEATHDDHLRVRDELLHAVGESLKIVDLSAPPAAAPAGDDDEMVFHAGDFVSRLPAALGDQLDVRDKDELAHRRRQRTRDLVLWRVFLGCAAALALCLLGEFALVGGKLWQKSRLAIVAAQAPAVENIKAADDLVQSISRRSTMRLLPFEMITLARSCMPPTVQFLRATTTGLYTLEVEAKTGTPADVGAYQTALTALPAVDKIDMADQRIREGVSNFKIDVTFKPDALQPATSIATATP